MQKISWAFVALLMFGSCSSEATWPDEERVAFLENCERTSGGQVSMCACLLEKVEEEYPDPNDALNISIAEVQEMAEDC